MTEKEGVKSIISDIEKLLRKTDDSELTVKLYNI